MGDLFCGTGTWGMGWEREGYTTAWGIDINPRKLRPLTAFRSVHPHAVAMEQDVNDVRATASAIDAQGCGGLAALIKRTAAGGTE